MIRLELHIGTKRSHSALLVCARAPNVYMHAVFHAMIASYKQARCIRSFFFIGCYHIVLIYLVIIIYKINLFS